MQIDTSNYHGYYHIYRRYVPAKLKIRDLILTITKSVTGAFGDKTKGFTFTLVSVDGASTGGPYNISITHVFEGTTTESTISVGGTFWMRDGDTVEIEGLPKGKTIVFSEDNGYYKTTWQLNNGTETNGNTVSVVFEDDSTLAVENRYDPPAPTGYHVDEMPYVWLGLGGLALLVLVSLSTRLRRRRRGGGGHA